MGAHFGLAFASPPSHNDLSLPLTITRRLIKQKARHPQLQFYPGLAQFAALPKAKLELGLTPCRRMISGTISLRSQRCFSPFPRGTCSLSVAKEYLALRRGRRRFTRNFSCVALLRKSLGSLWFSVTGLSPSVERLSIRFT